jgi:hypothetical protein
VHAAQLIGAGRLDLRCVVSESIEHQVRLAIYKVGNISPLAPIKAALPATIDYGEIRCVVALIQREKPTTG